MTPSLRAATLTAYTGSLRQAQTALVVAHRQALALGRELSADHLGALSKMDLRVNDLIVDAETPTCS